MTSSALSLLGLALRGNNLAVGEEPVEEACKTGRAKLVLTAADAARNSAERAERLAETAGAPWALTPWSKGELGAALGRSTCAVAAVTDAGLAAALVRKLADLDPAYRELAGDLAEETPRRPKSVERKKKSRAKTKKPAVS